jgi:hypothetical protein
LHLAAKVVALARLLTLKSIYHHSDDSDLGDK